ncbi:unnamed protein product [Allacma fusca]|uniref:Uncharacterized protein n=1 Tax=Allacma fusca TaxID=39272 RepID=A0A8J2L1S0_9HEXA|nr:unnamed protein product [Allacma fusca]
MVKRVKYEVHFKLRFPNSHPASSPLRLLHLVPLSHIHGGELPKVNSSVSQQRTTFSTVYFYSFGAGRTSSGNARLCHRRHEVLPGYPTEHSLLCVVTFPDPDLRQVQVPLFGDTALNSNSLVQIVTLWELPNPRVLKGCINYVRECMNRKKSAFNKNLPHRKPILDRMRSKNFKTWTFSHIHSLAHLSEVVLPSGTLPQSIDDIFERKVPTGMAFWLKKTVKSKGEV